MKTFAFPAAPLAACALLAAAATSAHADLIDINQPGTTLAMVVGNQFQVGDKLFSVPAGGFSSAAFNPAEIFISPIINADPDTGEGFRLTGAWNDPPGDLNSIFALTTDVAVLPGSLALGHRISGSALRFNGFATGPGSVARVDASLTVESQATGLMTVLADGSGVATLSAEQQLNNLSALRMTVTGSFAAAGDTGTAGASFIDLSFGRSTIPTPAAFGLLTAGVALATKRRRAR